MAGKAGTAKKKPEKKNGKLRYYLKQTLYWVGAALCLLLAIVFEPSISSLLFFILALTLVPINPVIYAVRRILRRTWFRVIFRIALVILAFLIAPASRVSKLRSGIPSSCAPSVSASDSAPAEFMGL